MVTVFALIGQAFLHPCRKAFPATALRLGKALLGLPEFVRMDNLLARGEREQMLKAWVNPYRAIASRRNRLGLGVDEETQIPARCSLHNASAFDTTLGKVLRMEPH